MAQKPRVMGDLLRGGAPAGSTEAFTKAAGEAAVGERFEAQKRAALEDMIGTMGWAGQAFGGQANAAFEPTIQKLAGIQIGIVDAINAAIDRLEKIAKSGGGIGGIGGVKEDVHTEAAKAPNTGAAWPTNAAMGDNVKGWSEVEALIEQMKTKNVTSNTVMHGKTRPNAGKEHPEAYERGKAAADAGTVQAVQQVLGHLRAKQAADAGLEADGEAFLSRIQASLQE